MSDELLPYYNRELSLLRNMGAEFAEAHPKIAGRLRLDPDMALDPHVDRIIQAFAYLNARTRHKLEDDFPEISEAFLNVLYPHYLAPVPSMAIVKFELDPAQGGELTEGYTIERHATVETESIDGRPCRFRTCYPVKLWPIDLKSASFRAPPVAIPETQFNADTLAVVSLELECFSQDVTFDRLPFGSLRFFLKGQSQHTHVLYELLMNNTLAVVVASTSEDRDPVVLPGNHLEAVGFRRDEGMLDYSPRSFLGYRLLTEYFAFPEKYLFFDITGLTPDVLAGRNGRLKVFFLLNRYSEDLERNVSRDTFQLGCCPMVNLFRQRAEPIPLSQTQYEYRVVPDERHPRAHEVYSIDRVVAVSPDNVQVDFQPFYSLQHAHAGRSQRTFWHAARRPAGHDGGTEVFLSLVDLDLSPSAPADWTLDVETTCVNRNLPHRLPFGGGQPRLQLAAGAPLAKAICLTPPTKTLRPALRHGTLWRLVSHLSLNHISLVDGEDGAEAMREILKLYDFKDSAETRTQIDGLLRIKSRRVVGRVGGEVAAGFCRGVEVTLHFDENKFSGSGVFLFASVLEHFLALYSSINAFTRTVATSDQREEVLHR